MVATLLTIIIIAGFALHQYIKGGLVKGFIFLMATLAGMTAAFGYYEPAADYIKDYSFIGPKAYLLAFFLLFLFVFVLVREVANYLLKPDISFGEMIEKVGGIALGVTIGYIFSGVVLITIGLVPFKANWLYGRFEDSVSNPPQSNKVLLNPDGFVSGFFGILSSGSLKGDNSFALVHVDYVDQIFLNRYLIDDGVSSIAASGAVSITAPGVWAAPENLMEAPKEKKQAPQPVSQEQGKTLILMRLRISPRDLVPEGSETQPKLGMSQLRLVLRDKQDAGDLSSGSGEAAYPIGYINSDGQLQATPLNASLGEDELKKGNVDFAFYMPANNAAVLMEFRQNIIEHVRPMKPAEQPAQAQPVAEPNSTEPNSTGSQQ